MIKVITKEEIISHSSREKFSNNCISVSSSIKKVSSPDPDCLNLIDKKVFSIFLSGGKLGIPNSEKIHSIKIKEKSLPISVSPSNDNELKYFLSLIVLEDDLDDIQIEFEDLSEERQKKLNQIL